MPAPNIFNFFKPHKGHPLAKQGMAEFLAANGKAWATLDVLGGEVSWDHGRPMIIVQGGGGSGLPPGGDQYQVLQRDGDGNAVWDWVRAANIPE